MSIGRCGVCRRFEECRVRLGVKATRGGCMGWAAEPPPEKEGGAL